MLKQSLRTLSLLVLSLAASASALDIMPLPTLPTAYSVSPNPGPANKEFSLYLYGATADCNTAFARESVTVSTSEMRINLSYVKRSYSDGPSLLLSKELSIPVAPCPYYDYTLNGTDVKLITPYYGNVPTYKIPALKPGVYDVFVTEMHECLYTQPYCKIGVSTVSAGTLSVKLEGAISYEITPAKVESGKAFELNLLSYDFNCGTYFDNMAVNIVGDVITLSFLDHVNPAAICPEIYKPYGPTFKIEPLRAGNYKVKAYRHPSCLPCKMLGETVDVGTLTITGAVTRQNWFLKNPTVGVGKGFEFQLLNNAYGNCHTSFSHQTLSAQAEGIYASFLIENDSNRVCITDIRPHGPTFQMQALKPGAYPIYVTELYECEIMAPFCAIKREAPAPADTLVVGMGVTTLLSELRTTPSAGKVLLHGSRAGFTLPEGIGGTWKVDLLSVKGQRLSSTSVNAEAGSRVDLDLGVRPEVGVYLLRLSAPDGETHTLPTVRMK